MARNGGDGSPETPRADGPVTAEREALLRHLAELLAYTAHYSAARLDRVVLSVREGAMTGLILAGLGLFGLATAIICMVLLLQGFAGGLSVALDGALWGGQLIVGGGILLLMGLAGVIVLAVISARLRHARVEKYEKLKSNERARLGRDVDSAARAAR